MAVAAHLTIALTEYDQRIRTFIPYYEEMLDAAAAGLSALAHPQPTIVELGVGTGALASRALARQPRARLIGIDADPAILKLAGERLAQSPAWAQSHDQARVELIDGNFTTCALPRCHAVLASLALHHLPNKRRKMRLYAKIFDTLQPGGMLISADAFPASLPTIAEVQMQAWRAHLERSYSPDETTGFFAAWATEDVYMPLTDEIDMLSGVGFTVEVLWRREGFAVVAATKLGRRRHRRHRLA